MRFYLKRASGAPISDRLLLTGSLQRPKRICFAKGWSKALEM